MPSPYGAVLITRRFERPHRRRPDCNNRTAFFFGGIQSLRSIGSDVIPLCVKLFLLPLIFFKGRECAEMHMQCHVFDADALRSKHIQ